MITKRYRFRAYPNKHQRELIAKTFGCSRFVFNYFLNRRIKVYEEEHKTLRVKECSKELTQLKQELPWLQEVDKWALQNAIKDLNMAFERFFNHQNGYPKFKSKRYRQSYRTTCSKCGGGDKYNVEYKDGKIKIPKVGWVKVRDKRIPKGRILNAAILKMTSGDYYISLCCTDIEEEILPKTNKIIGLDLGVRDFAITSDGDKYPNNRYLEQVEKKIAKIQRGLSRKTKGGSNYNKAVKKLGKLYDKAYHQWMYYKHSLSTKLIRENDIIYLEHLDIMSMFNNKGSQMNKNIHNVGWYVFISQLKYKADWYGKEVVQIDQYVPTTQVCSCCGYKNDKLQNNTHTKKWICPNCGAKLDRDINAAKNILNEGLRISAVS